MKLSNIGRNPLQSSLIDAASMPIFGEPLPARDAQRVEGQRQRVEAIMSDGYWHTVPGLQKELRLRFGQLYSETSISARLREMRRRGYTVAHERTRAGSNLYQYRAVKNGEAETAQARQRSAAVLRADRDIVVTTTALESEAVA